MGLPGWPFAGLAGLKVAIEKTEMVTEDASEDLSAGALNSDGNAELRRTWSPLAALSPRAPAGFTVYLLRVRHLDAGWGGVRRKRFADFTRLADTVNAAIGVHRPFPSKRLLFNLDPETVEERRVELQEWLLATLTMHEHVARLLRDFVEEPVAMEWGGLADGLPALAMDALRFKLADGESAPQLRATVG